MQFTPADPASLMGFLATCFLVIALLFAGAGQVDKGLKRKLILFILGWLAVTSGIVASGVLAANVIPGVPMLFALINLCALTLGLSAWGKKLAQLPAWQIAVFQSFRLPLEMVLHQWAKTGTVPPTMTWTGQNFDILTGLFALFFLAKPLRKTWALWLFNCTGIVLLLNVFRVVIMSSPFPFAWPLEQPIQLVFHFPYVLIGTVCVWGAILGHVVLTRALLQRA